MYVANGLGKQHLVGNLCQGWLFVCLLACFFVYFYQYVYNPRKKYSFIYIEEGFLFVCDFGKLTLK